MTSWAPGMVSPKWPAGIVQLARVDPRLDWSGPRHLGGPVASPLAGPVTAAQTGQRLLSPLDFTGDARTDVLQIASER